MVLKIQLLSKRRIKQTLAANLQNAAKVSDIVSLAGFEFEKEITKTAEQYKR